MRNEFLVYLRLNSYRVARGCFERNLDLPPLPLSFFFLSLCNSVASNLKLMKTTETRVPVDNHFVWCARVASGFLSSSPSHFFPSLFDLLASSLNLNSSPSSSILSFLSPYHFAREAIIPAWLFHFLLFIFCHVPPLGVQCILVLSTDLLYQTSLTSSRTELGWDRWDLDQSEKLKGAYEFCFSLGLLLRFEAIDWLSLQSTFISNHDSRPWMRLHSRPRKFPCALFVWVERACMSEHLEEVSLGNLLFFSSGA